MIMQRDFRYWGLDELSLEPCCALKFHPKMQICTGEIEKDTAEKKKEDNKRKEEDFGNTKVGEIR